MIISWLVGNKCKINGRGKQIEVDYQTSNLVVFEFQKKALLFSYDSFERREPEVSGFFSYYVMKIIYIFKNTAFNLLLDDLLSILYIQI